MNAQFYTDKLKYHKGRGSNEPQEITIGERWKFTQADKKYTSLGDGGDITTAKSGSGDSCTCKNALKEVKYNVAIKANSEVTDAIEKYQIESITADVVVQDITGGCTTQTGVPQKFEIEFISKKDEAVGIQKKSGNPGYFDAFPVKIGFQKDGPGTVVQTYIDGFEISGSNDKGECIPKVTDSDTEVIDYGDPVLNFKQDLTYGCSILKAQDELKSFCEDAAVKD